MPLATILKDVAMLSQWLQCIMLWLDQYRVHTIYKPSPDLYIMDLLSRNYHTGDKDQEIASISMNMNTISPSAQQ